MYKEFARVAREEGFDELAAKFEGVAEVEHAHEDRYNKLKENLDSGSVFNNKRVRRYNELIKDLAAEKEAHYLDVYSSMANENGDLPAGGAFDGIHPYSKYYKAWREYLQTHTVLEVKP